MVQFTQPCSVLITGCNCGIGLEFVKQISSRWPKTRIYATVRELSLIPENSELRRLARSSNLISIRLLDIDNENSINELASELSKELGDCGLNLLINNAGVTHKPIFNHRSDDDIRYPPTILCETTESFMNLFRTNVVGTFNVTKHFIPLMIKCLHFKPSKFATKSQNVLVVNVSSQMGSISDNSSGAFYSYRASKAALNAVTRSLSLDLKSINIGCIAVHPGWVKTNIGGPNALITPTISVNGLLNVIESYKPKSSGKFLSFQNIELPW